MRLRIILQAAWLAVMIGVAPLASAQSVAPAVPIEMDAEEGEVEVVEEATRDPLAVEYVDFVIEGTVTSVRSRAVGDADRVYNITDIAEALRSSVEQLNTLLGYRRFQDGVLMSIDMADGKVRSNKVVLGRLPGFEPRAEADPWVDINAVTVLSGTHASKDGRGRTVLTLDDQLKPQFGLELWVNGAPVDTFGNEPRTIGPVLLLPLEETVEALGHTLTRENGTVTVLRTQDQASISLELATGLISVNTTPRGVTPDMHFAERDTLLLPFTAVEALTGTHVRLVPGTNRVEVTLDDRLEASVLPSGDIAEEVRNTPFTPEALSYELSDRGPLRAEMTAHWKHYNLRGRVETAGGFDNFASTQPAWASLDVASLEGWDATLGDYNANFRELASIDQTRIRGASWRRQQPNGTIIAIAAGVPLTGSKQDSETIAVPEFSGATAGARVISKDRTKDIGIAATISEDGETGEIVVGGQAQLDVDPKETGLQSAYISGDVGAFSGAVSGVDIRARASASYAASRQIGFSGSAYYEGAKFIADKDPVEDEDSDPEVDNEGARSSLTARAYWRGIEPMGIFNRNSAGLSVNLSHNGGEQEETRTTVTLSTNTQLGAVGPTLSATLQQTEVDAGDDVTNTNSLRVRANQRFDWGSANASYQYSETSSDEAVQQLFASVQTRPLRKRYENGAQVMFAPSVNVNWDGENTTANLGGTLSAESGRAFGNRFSLNGRLSALSDFSNESEESADTRFFGSLNARYKLSKNAYLSAVYTDDFNGSSDFSVGLKGRFVFNEPRQYRLPDEGRGVLMGRVFLDRNRDGVRQPNEPGVPGVQVQLVGTRLGLNTGREGLFTIQNVQKGLYIVSVHKRSLPLGYMVPEDAQPRVTIGDGRRSEVDVPIILSGQVRGAVFVDRNGNGTADSGEERLEGQWIRLIPIEGGDAVTIHTATFGQFAFEEVAPGGYRLEVTISGQPVSVDVTVEAEEPFIVQSVAVPPDIADGGGGIDLSAGLLGAP